MNRFRPIKRRAFLVGLAAAPIAAATLSKPSEGTYQSAAAQSGNAYFAETGHNLKSPFLDQWAMMGGEQAIGIPISEERFQEGVGVVQSFEGITLVLDPDIPPPGDVAGEKLPESLIDAIAPESALKTIEGCPDDAFFCQYFVQTGHSVSGRFSSYWSTSGDMSVIGLPVSEPFKDQESGRMMQVFERAVLVDHGESDVRLAKIGAELSADSIEAGELAFAPAPPTGGSTKLVKSPDGLRLRSGPNLDAEIIVVLPDSAEFITVPGSAGEWIPGYADGYAGWVSSEFLKEPPPLPTIDQKDWNLKIWQGATLGETNVRSQPTTSSEIVEVLPGGSPIEVTAWVEGEEVFTGADEWAKLDSNSFIYARNVGRNSPVLPTPLPANAPASGNWIDVQLTQQLMTLYEDREAVRVIVMTSGMAGWETPEGDFQVLVRVANETMTSGAIGAEHFYKLEDVLFTQYFSNEGHAIHFAWWRTPETIGRPGSHGCINVLLDDARFLWEWADIGTPIIVHKA